MPWSRAGNPPPQKLLPGPSHPGSCRRSDLKRGASGADNQRAPRRPPVRLFARPAVIKMSFASDQYFCIYRNMETKQALDAFSALSQETRLGVLRHLIQALPGNIAAGDIARDLDVPASTLSTHLAILSRAGLVTSE